MRALPAIFALLVAAVGWYYLWYSQAIQRLARIEEQRTTRRLGILRRINAIIMLLIALGIACGTYRFEREGAETACLITWALVMLLLFAFVLLALIDLPLTIKLRQQIRE